MPRSEPPHRTLDPGAPPDPWRRRGLLGGAAAALLPALPALWPAGVRADAACRPLPEQTEGPFGLRSALADPRLSRSDITEQRPGLPLQLSLRVLDTRAGCRPLGQVAVYVWHCDRDGQYSGYRRQVGDVSTVGQVFLRGLQWSDGDGRVRFDTLYPGWYPGRITHIHVQVLKAGRGGGLAPWVTSQIVFPDEVNEAVYRSAGYRGRGSNHSVPRLDQDFLGRDDVAAMMARISGDPQTRLAADLDLGIAAG